MSGKIVCAEREKFLLDSKQYPAENFLSALLVAAIPRMADSAQPLGAAETAEHLQAHARPGLHVLHAAAHDAFAVAQRRFAQEHLL